MHYIYKISYSGISILSAWHSGGSVFLPVKWGYEVLDYIFRSSRARLLLIKVFNLLRDICLISN